MAALLVVLALPGCGDSSGRAACGFSSVAGANLLLGAFATPNVTLSAPPRRVPATLPARVVAGPLYSAAMSRPDSLLVATITADSAAHLSPGSGVLIQDTSGRTRGIVLFDAPPVAGAPVIGSVVIGARSAPLVGINVDPTPYQDARCPLFPDSAAK